MDDELGPDEPDTSEGRFVADPSSLDMPALFAYTPDLRLKPGEWTLGVNADDTKWALLACPLCFRLLAVGKHSPWKTPHEIHADGTLSHPLMCRSEQCDFVVEHAQLEHWHWVLETTPGCSNES